VQRIDIPRKTIYRLSIYQRCLARARANGIDTISSEALAKAAGVKSTQLRKDLTYFGQFGTRGLGYNVEQLAKMISDVGNLGSALLRYGGFNKEGFEITAAFDLAPSSNRIADGSIPLFPMQDLPEYVEEHTVRMAILTVPATAAQSVTNQLVAAGIRAILNFSPTVLDVPPEIKVNSVDLAVELENLSYFIS
jgi:redox-sensing transcriptional repressor